MFSPWCELQASSAPSTRGSALQRTEAGEKVEMSAKPAKRGRSTKVEADRGGVAAKVAGQKRALQQEEDSREPSGNSKRQAVALSVKEEIEIEEELQAASGSSEAVKKEGERRSWGWGTFGKFMRS